MALVSVESFYAKDLVLVVTWLFFLADFAVFDLCWAWLASGFFWLVGVILEDVNNCPSATICSQIPFSFACLLVWQFYDMFEAHAIDVFLPFSEGVEIMKWFDEWWGHRGYTIIRHPCRLPSKCVIPFSEGVEIMKWFDEWWGHRGYTIIRHPCRLPSKCVIP